MIRYEKLGMAIPEILLPSSQVDYEKWAVVACDQFTSDPEYWEQVDQIVGAAPSTLRLIFPEVFLGRADVGERIQKIRRAMNEYLEQGVLQEQGPCLVYTERRFKTGALRQGLMLALDLECYDFHPAAETLIRATEGTIIDRLPPRVKIRDGAPLELPHIMVLIDDPEDMVFGKVTKMVKGQEPLYEIELMLNGGHLCGYKLGEQQDFDGVTAALKTLADPEHFSRKYGVTGKQPLLYAVGDGNHSLATAKATWEMVKERAGAGVDLEDHPARYALVELVNLHSSGLDFEPIHRVLFKANLEVVFEQMQRFFAAAGAQMNYGYFGDVPLKRLAELREEKPGAHIVGFVTADACGYLELPAELHNLAVGVLQMFLDDYLKGHPQAELDYIHGADAVYDLGSRPGNIGFYLPSLEKNQLFKTVILDGVLPRKTFSMGEAEEKRYYMECRKINC